MREYVTEAVILSREPQGEADMRITLWSRTLGRMRGRATSARKITSKLSAHLEPGMLSSVRLVENKNLQVVDALKERRLAIAPPDLLKLSRLLEHGEPDEDLWAALVAPRWSWTHLLTSLGWDPREASCVRCGRRAEAFAVDTQDFFCEICASKLPPDAVVYMHDAPVQPFGNSARK